jgi:hypothetical protein
MTNIRKGKLEELPRLGAAFIDSRHGHMRILPTGRSLAGRSMGSVMGRGRHYLAAARTASPVYSSPAESPAAEQAPLDLVSLLDALLKSADDYQGRQMQDDFNPAPPPERGNGSAIGRGRHYPAPANTVAPMPIEEAESALPETLPEEWALSASVPVQSAADEPAPKGIAPTGSSPAESASFLNVLVASTAKRSHQVEIQDDFRTVPPPDHKSSAGALVPVLNRSWEWLKKSQKLTNKKQLRVSDTVGLGEKRFVALLHFEGRKFVIGGGASSVSLLTELGEASAVSGVMKQALLSGSAE